jgi:hypothetical protein
MSDNPAIQSAIAAMIGTSAVGAVGGAEAMLRVQNAELLNRLENVEKLAGNHIGHLNGAMGVQDFFQSPTFKWALVIAAIAAVFYLLEKGDSKTRQGVGNKILDLAIKKI